MSKPSDLIAYLFSSHPHPLSPLLLRWLETSPRYTTFVDLYLDKIRKKLRTARDPASALDVRSELEVAYALLTDRRLSLAYEPYASEKRRGPDFAVTYRANLIFNVEVTRMHAELTGAAAVDLPRSQAHLLSILFAKLGQMQPAMPNLLVIITPEDLARTLDLAQLMQTLKTSVEAKDPAFYAATQYPNPAAFYKDFLRLSGILLWCPCPQGWLNKASRPGLDEKVFRLLLSLAANAAHP